MFDPSFDLDLVGFSIIPNVLSSEEVSRLLTDLSDIPKNEGVRKKTTVYAIRNLVAAVPTIAALASSEKVMSLARSALGSHAFSVRATLFDKTADANWLVPWHQDLTICVRSRVEASGYGPWTLKAGIHHVQPPVEILESMLAIRIHLDDCHANNGALRVLPATHRFGRLTAEQIDLDQRNISPITCAVERGGALLIKPLLLHASSAALDPSHRRVLHLDFASCQLAPGLAWFNE